MHFSWGAPHYPEIYAVYR